MTKRLLVLVLAILGFGLSSTANADLIYLNGVITANVSPTTGESPGFEYDSFDTPNNDVTINNVTQTSFLLTLGANNFVLNGNGGTNGLGLFFTPTATQLTNANSFGRLPDLSVFFAGSVIASQAAGIEVFTLGQFSGNLPYSGATSFSIGSETVSVTAWNGTNLQLTVTSVPEPSSASLLMIASATFAWRCRKRMLGRTMG